MGKRWFSPGQHLKCRLGCLYMHRSPMIKKGKEKHVTKKLIGNFRKANPYYFSNEREYHGMTHVAIEIIE
jgi:hypothetical protein